MSFTISSAKIGVSLESEVIGREHPLKLTLPREAEYLYIAPVIPRRIWAHNTTLVGPTDGSAALKPEFKDGPALRPVAAIERPVLDGFSQMGDG